MKIGIYDPYLDSVSGGEKYMLTLATSLAKKHSVHILWDKKQEEYIRHTAYKKLGIQLDGISFADNFFTKDLPLQKRLAQSKKYDRIIYLSDGSIPLVLSKLIIHFQFPVEWVVNDYKTQLKMRLVHKIICNSEFTKNYIDKKFSVNSAILYPPVPIPKVPESVKENIILHVGRFGIDKEGANYKKQDIMIEAFKTMVDQGLTKWKFILVISYREEDREKLKSLKNSALGYPIVFAENPKNEKLWELYGKAKIYWHASGFGEDIQKHPEKAEHFGISTVEAMSQGAVPVVINMGGQKEIVQSGINGFLWNTIEELQKKTQALARDSKLLEKMSEKARVRAPYFGIERFGREINEIII